MRKRRAILLALLLLVPVFAFCASRHAWRLFGFHFCANPHSIQVADIVIDSDNNTVELRGDTAASAPAFVGFTYKIEGGTLYVGVKYNLLLGFSDRDGRFDIRIPTAAAIDKIVMLNGRAEETIYEREHP